MKQINKISSVLAAGAVAMSLLLGASAAQAAVVTDGPVATGITNLDVNGTLYNVDFVADNWSGVYNDPPEFDFNDPSPAAEAVDAVNAALNLEGVSLVGESSTTGSPVFMIGFGSFDSIVEGTLVLWLGGAYSTPDPDAWISDIAGNPFGGSATDLQPLMWADFAPVPVPAAVWLFGSGLLGLVGIARRKISA